MSATPLSDPQAEPARAAWIDNLRTLIIGLVVNLHACVTYSHVGGWYVMEGPGPVLPVKIAFIIWEGHLQAFFMGLLFFFAGIFAHGSLTRRGPAAFLRERATRLGLPSLLFMLAIQPLIVNILLGLPTTPDRPSLAVLYSRYLLSGRVLSGSGPMWFALALLFFCAVLAGFRALRPAPLERAETSAHAPGGWVLLGFGLMLVMSTFLVRVVQPLGISVLNFSLGFFAQYIAAFALGVVAGRHGWLDALADSRPARIAGWLGVIGGPMLLVGVLWLGGPPPENGPIPYAGGWNFRALGLAAWEQLAGLGIALGIMSFFGRFGNTSGRLAAWLSERSFAVYLLHAPVLVALTVLIRPLAFGPFTGATVLTGVGLVASFAAADVARRIPGLRRIL